MRRCFTLLFFVSFFMFRSIANGQGNACINVGFEDGTFSNWQGNWQDRHTGGDTDPVTKPATLQNNFELHSIMKPTDIDPLIPGLKVVAPGSARSARLGNIASGGHIARLSRSFVVDSSNLIFTYRYAIVLDDPTENGVIDKDHAGDWAPHFSAKLLNSSGTPITCGSYTAVVGALSMNEFKTICSVDVNDSQDNVGTVAFPVKDTALAEGTIVPVNADGEPDEDIEERIVQKPDANGACNNGRKKYFYKDWTTISIPLTAYLGQTVTLEFAAADCRPNGHFGYAYVDADCKPLKLNQPGLICEARGGTTKIHAPAGFKSYNWTGPGIVSGKNDSVLTVNKIGQYDVILTPFSDVSNCEATLTYFVQEYCPPVSYKDSVCEGSFGSGQAKVSLNSYNAKVVGSSGATVASWHTGTPAGSGNIIASPTNVTVTNSSVFYAKTTVGDIKTTFKIIGLPGPAGPITGPTPVCANTTGAVYSIAPIANATSYSWTVPAEASITAGMGTTGITADFGTSSGTIAVIAGNSCGTVTSSVAVTVNPNLPVSVTINTPPAICPGEEIIFVASPVNEGDTPTYKWFVNNTQQASTASTFKSTTLVDGDKVMAELTSSLICKINSPATSNIETISVFTVLVPKVSIEVEPSTTVCEGITVKYKAIESAGGSNSVFAWRLNNEIVPGAATDSLTIQPQPYQLKTGDKVSVVMKSSSTCATDTAFAEVIMTVKPIPVLTPVSVTLCSGLTTNIALTTTPNVPGTTFSWPVPVSATVNGGLSGGMANIANQLKTVSATPQTIIYTVTPEANGCVGAPANVPVTVNPIPEVIASDAILCSGASTNIALSSNVASGVSYSWSGTGGGAASGTANPVKETLTNNTTAAANAIYNIIATANNCTGPVKLITVKVKPIPVITGSHPPICSGTAMSIALQTNITTPGAGTSYAWTGSGSSGNVNGYAITGSSNPIAATLNNTGTASETVTYAITPTVDGCPGSATPIAVLVKPIPVAKVSGIPVLCGGNSTQIGVTSGVPGTTYTWEMGVSGGGKVTGAASGTVSNDSIKEVLSNISNAPGVAKYTVTPSANGCAGLPVNVSVTVNPAPNAKATGLPLCSGSTTNIPITTDASGMTVVYSWTSAVTKGTVTGQNPAGSTGTPIAETLTNPDPTEAELMYTIIPSANGCVGAATTTTVTVKPIPMAITLNNKPVVCSGENTAIDISSLTPNTQFNVVAAGAGSKNVSTTDATKMVQTLTSTTQTNAAYTIIPSANGCPGPPENETVAVHPIPVSAAGPDMGMCIGDSVRIGTGRNVTYTYKWSPGFGLSNDTLSDPVTGTLSSIHYTVTTTLKAYSKCQSKDLVTVTVTPKFTVDAGPDVLICPNDPVTLTASPSGLVSYEWNSGETGPTIHVAPEGTSTYAVEASNGGCRARDTVLVNVKNVGNPTLYIPNSFSPNNDGHNDVFKAMGEGIVEFEGVIFDRWGTMFYKWTDVNTGWNGVLDNGEKTVNDVYIYNIKVKNLCDKKFRDPHIGIITVIK